MRKILFWLVAFDAALACAETPLDVPLIDTPPVIDGALSEPVWQTALLVDDFVARLPIDGAKPSERTEVHFLHTTRALHVGLRAFDSNPMRIVLPSMRRDDFAITQGDQFVIAIDSFHDRRSGYWFSTNPLGVRVDAQFSDEGERFEDNWNGVWDAAARIESDGWTAELAIPWSTLRFREGPDVVMGINLFRRIPRTNEQIFAPAIPLVYRYGTPNVSAARAYRFRNISGGSRVDLRPFALSTTDDLDAGLFVRVPVSDSVTLAGTYRADFSEVEADETTLNLTRFPLFLPEKRDFFLEQAGLFTFGVPGEAELFFSRTIGLTERIRWGTKATGRAGRLEFGSLVADTAAERFLVNRARLGIGSRSYVGGFWSERSDRRTLGVDASHVFPSEVRLQGFASRSERANAWWMSIDRGGDRTSFVLSALRLDPGFAPAVGLVARPGTLRLESSGTFPWFPPETSRVRRYAPSLSWARYNDLRGPGFDERFVGGFEVSTKSDHSVRWQLIRQRELLTEPFAIFRDVIVPAGRYDRWEGRAIVTTNPTRTVSGQFEVVAGGLYGGTHRLASATLSFRPSRFLVFAPSLIADRVELP